MKSFFRAVLIYVIYCIFSFFAFITACSSQDDISGAYVQKCGNNKIILTSDHVCKAYFEVIDWQGNIDPELVEQDVQKLSREACDRKAGKREDISFEISDDNDVELSATVQGEKVIFKRNVALSPGPMLIRNIDNQGTSEQYFFATAVRAFNLLWRVGDQNMIECYAIARSDSGKELQRVFVLLKKDGDSLEVLRFVDNTKGFLNKDKDDKFVKLK